MADSQLKQFFLNGGMNTPGSKYFTLNRRVGVQKKQTTVKKSTVKPRKKASRKKTKTIKGVKRDIL